MATCHAYRMNAGMPGHCAVDCRLHPPRSLPVDEPLPPSVAACRCAICRCEFEDVGTALSRSCPASTATMSYWIAEWLKLNKVRCGTVRYSTAATRTVSVSPHRVVSLGRTALHGTGTVRHSTGRKKRTVSAALYSAAKYCSALKVAVCACKCFAALAVKSSCTHLPLHRQSELRTVMQASCTDSGVFCCAFCF